MYPVLDLKFTVIPTYGLLSVIGFFFALILYIHIANWYHIPKCDVLYASIYGMTGLIIGAKFVFFLTTVPEAIAHFDLFLKHPWEFIMFMFGGWVFYGGLIGGALGIVIYCKQFHMEVMAFGDSIAPVIPFFHVFGRIGCHLAGCCYGMEFHGPLAVTFPLSKFTAEMAGIPRFPTQLVEVFFNFILFIILYTYVKRKPKHGRPLGVYLVAYTMMRFTLEFFRGDIERGGFLGLSTSQWISLVLLPIGGYLIFRFCKNQKPVL